MPAKKKAAKSASKNTSPPSFEQAMEQLEGMVEQMESGDLPLEELIGHYEQGAKLITRCEQILGDARKRLDLITLTPSPDPGDAGTTSTNDGANTPDTDNDDEIRLF